MKHIRRRTCNQPKQSDLALIREQRARAQQQLAGFHQRILEWGSVVRDVQHTERTNNSFPNLQTEEDWVTMTRNQAERYGESVLSEAKRLRREMEGIDARTTGLLNEMNRPNSARVMVLSLLFISSDVVNPQQSQASGFFRWLHAAAGSGAKAPTVAANATDGEDVTFDFGLLPYQGSKDVGGGSARSVFGYDGSLTEPPCTPIVRWFVASEPLTASSRDLLALVNGSLSANLSRAAGGSLGDLWWEGGIEEAPETGAKLPSKKIWTSVLSTEPFKKTEERLSSDTMSLLSWDYIRFYCMAFLLCSLIMLCTTCGMWARQCLEQ
mmetsp:Transcript_59874/g.193965  ORF Transcript_59874/g.193965 Transcript_59874/m.193965 type:complete len:324 (+) Transcript_59874:87-1058(+)